MNSPMAVPAIASPIILFRFITYEETMLRKGRMMWVPILNFLKGSLEIKMNLDQNEILISSWANYETSSGSWKSSLTINLLVDSSKLLTVVLKWNS